MAGDAGTTTHQPKRPDFSRANRALLWLRLAYHRFINSYGEMMNRAEISTMVPPPNHNITTYQEINHAYQESAFVNSLAELTGDLSPATIYRPVEQALTDYHDLACLARNPLTTLLQLEIARGREQSQVNDAGVALRALLDRTLDVITGVLPDEGATQSGAQLAGYLHWRYRQKMQFCDLANRLGYTEHHLCQLHRELILEAAEVMLQLRSEVM
jgi:hypothetical protein